MYKWTWILYHALFTVFKLPLYFISSALYSVSVLGRAILVLYNYRHINNNKLHIFLTYFSSLQTCTCILIFTMEVYGERNYTGINVITDKIISTKLNNNNNYIIIIIIILLKCCSWYIQLPIDKKANFTN